MKYIVFETTPDTLSKRGEYEVPDFVTAAELVLTSFKMVRYNKQARQEILGTFHMLDCSTGEIHWIRVEGPHHLALEKIPADSEGPLPWLIGPLLDTARDALERERDELEETCRELERQKERAETKIGELMDVIQSASSDITNVRSEINNTTLPNFDDLRDELKSRLEGAVAEIVFDLVPNNTNLLNLEDIDSTLSGIETDLENADGDIN